MTALAAVLTIATFVSTSPKAARAVSFELETEFDTGATGPYANVTIEEIAGSLEFEIVLDTGSLGSDADLHMFYFNLLGVHDVLEISNTNAPTTEYGLTSNPSVRGGAGSSFDWEVHFGNGAGSKGNGVLQTASFSITADEDLEIADLILSSFAAGGSIEINMAAHIQGTHLFANSDSETIGGVVPEPSTGLLVMLGLGLLARPKIRRPAAQLR